jgi:hypothetical protein
MNLLVPCCLMLVILTCSIAILVEFVTRPLRAPLSEGMIRDYQFPVSRLLDSKDFDYLRRAGFSRAKARAFRANRRSIARLWLRTLGADFNSVDRTLSLLLVSSQIDRSDLASILARQRAVFCWRFLQAEFNLALDACGFWSSRPLASLNNLESLCASIHEFAVTVQPVCSVA